MNYLSQLFYFIYRLPLFQTALMMVLIVSLWALLMRLTAKRSGAAVAVLNALLLLAALGGILYITLLRPTANKRELILQPFQSFVEAKMQREMYREMLMNVFLFVPFGLFAPFVLAGVPRLRAHPLRTALTAVLIAALLSVAIEALQYVFALGRCETDDVLCNTFGSFLGSLSLLIYSQKERKRYAQR